MKKILLSFTCLAIAFSAIAQSFTRLEIGDIVTTPSDSRSVNFADVNNDGWDDIFISNGLSGGQKDFLYLNDQNGNFTAQSGFQLVEDELPSVGASMADFDNDGDIDVYVTNWYNKKNKLYENDGTGIFAAAANSTIQPLAFSETATWGDYNFDGLLDLFLTNSDGTNKTNALYENLGASAFEKTSMAPWSAIQNISRNANWVDYDNDGDPDLYITNEGTRKNELYRNEGSGNFTLIIQDIFINRAYATMTSSWGDIDNDGDLDLFLGNSGYFAERPNALFRNLGNGEFAPIEEGAAATANGCNYGSTFGDVDNDGDLDLLVTSAFCDAQELQDQLYLNDGTGIFDQASSLPGNQDVASYGTAMGDLNKDGFLDIVVAHCQNNSASPMPANAVYFNATNSNHWVSINLEGVTSNRSGVGARVFVYSQKNGEPLLQMRELNTQSGYSGQNSLIAHFGLGASALIDSIRVEWPSGIVSQLPAQTADQEIMIVEEIQSTTGNLRWLENALTIYPNPISAKDTQLTIELPEDILLPMDICLSIFDSNGKELVKENKLADTRLIRWEGINGKLSSGVNYLRLLVDGKLIGVEKIVMPR